MSSSLSSSGSSSPPSKSTRHTLPRDVVASAYVPPFDHASPRTSGSFSNHRTSFGSPKPPRFSSPLSLSSQISLCATTSLFTSASTSSRLGGGDSTSLIPPNGSPSFPRRVSTPQHMIPPCLSPESKSRLSADNANAFTGPRWRLPGCAAHGLDASAPFHTSSIPRGDPVTRSHGPRHTDSSSSKDFIPSAVARGRNVAHKTLSAGAGANRPARARHGTRVAASFAATSPTPLPSPTAAARIAFASASSSGDQNLM
eukprot:10722-Pelagococcus_subviridis.AAC.7